MVTTGSLLLSLLVELWVLVAHLALPARQVDGYVRDAKGKPLRYRLNGIPVLVTTVLSWAGLCYSGILPWDYLYRHAGTTCAVACAAGLLGTAALVLPAPPRLPSFAADLFLGRVLNPRGLVAGRLLDVKMYLYLVGAVHLELNVLSCAAAHYTAAGLDSAPVSTVIDRSSGPLLAAALLTWFVTEYLYFEDVHLYTYDLFAERVGFKLTWGCLCFYPFFYALPVYAVVGIAPASTAQSSLCYIAAVVVFFAGWALSRGANLQKFWFKQQADRRRKQPTTSDTTVVRSEDGKKELFCGGLWGVARHINYLGEILEAVGIAMAATAPAWVEPGSSGSHAGLLLWTAWLYPIYYVGLLVPRERDDDALCREKYGKLWEEYCRRVPWRIIPYLY